MSERDFPHQIEYEFSSSTDLKEACNDGLFITPNIRLARADEHGNLRHDFSERLILEILTSGDYGLQLVQPSLSDRGPMYVPLAVSGFRLHESEGIMEITHTPQGLSQTKLNMVGIDTLNKDAALYTLGRRRKGDGLNIFRLQLMEGLITIAKMMQPMGVKRIEGIAAEFHPSIRPIMINAIVDPKIVDVAVRKLHLLKRSIDEIYEACGFTRDKRANGEEYYYLELEARK